MTPIERPIRHQFWIYLTNRLSRLVGNIVKISAYPFHALFPHKRFTIPEYDPPRCAAKNVGHIPKTIWQTNYSNRVTLPVYCNYLINRLMSRDCEYRYVSTEARAEFIQKHADEATFAAYSRLTNGASQADFWRVYVLQQLGGIYIDIDAQLVCPVAWSVNPHDKEVIVYRKKEYSNYFMAIAAGHPLMAETLQIIKDNIANKNVHGGVFHMTGPSTLMQAMQGKEIHVRNARYTCEQGTFTNEYFQYLDKRNSKWTQAKNEDLLR